MAKALRVGDMLPMQYAKQRVGILRRGPLGTASRGYATVHRFWLDGEFLCTVSNSVALASRLIVHQRGTKWYVVGIDLQRMIGHILGAAKTERAARNLSCAIRHHIRRHYLVAD